MSRPSAKRPHPALRMPDDADAVRVLDDLVAGERLNSWERACLMLALKRLEGLVRPSARRER